jgi:hypothetical protein
MQNNDTTADTKNGLNAEPRLSLIPDIDKIYLEGREPTEEEWKIWAENFKPKSITERRPEHESRLKKDKAKIALKDRERKKIEYANRKVTGHKSWGTKYNAKRRYLAKYNSEYRARKEREQKLKIYKHNRLKYDSWVNNYRKNIKNRLDTYADIYKIGDNVYVHGFSRPKLLKFSPFSYPTFNKLFNEEAFPEPTYTGYQFKNNKISPTPTKFYLLTEVIAFLGVLDKNRKRIKKYSDVNIAFLQKKFWTEMLEARKEFENEQHEN